MPESFHRQFTLGWHPLTKGRARRCGFFFIFPIVLPARGDEAARVVGELVESCSRDRFFFSTF
jgi:hypothetical protein